MPARLSAPQAVQRVGQANGARHADWRVAFDLATSSVGVQTLVFDATAEGGARDRVEAVVPVQAPGIDERPRLAGGFSSAQDIRVSIPDDVFVDDDADDLVVTMGVALWPELGERVEFLVDYPHGCVEQTTSSTLPLLAARELLPRLGFLRYSQAQIDDRIRVGAQPHPPRAPTQPCDRDAQRRDRAPQASAAGHGTTVTMAMSL